MSKSSQLCDGFRRREWSLNCVMSRRLGPERNLADRMIQRELGQAGEMWEALRKTGLDAGLADIGVCAVGVLEPSRSVLRPRRDAGLSATMQFTYRNPDRSSDPARSLAGARSIVVGAWGYRRQQVEPPEGTSGRVASYAWRDHYQDLRSALETVAAELRGLGYQARVHLDDNNLVDRNVAFNAGLGWYGKNANLLLPGLGSWFVLGSVVTDAPLESSGPPIADGCGPCTRCLDECPTQAIVAPGIVDAGRCIAWLVQGPGEIPVEFRAAVGDRIYGCDDCQEVCPPNQRGEPPPPEIDIDPWIEIEWILSASDEELMDRVGRWYMAGRDPNVVRRTALVVLGNIGDPGDERIRDLLDDYRQRPNEILNEHASWAAEQLGLDPVAS